MIRSSIQVPIPFHRLCRQMTLHGPLLNTNMASSFTLSRVSPVSVGGIVCILFTKHVWKCLYVLYVYVNYEAKPRVYCATVPRYQSSRDKVQ